MPFRMFNIVFTILAFVVSIGCLIGGWLIFGDDYPAAHSLSAILALFGFISYSFFGDMIFRRALCRQRETLSEDVIYDRFFRDSGIPREQIVEVWNLVARAVGLPPGKLRPDDRFGETIGSCGLTDTSIEALQDEVNKRLPPNEDGAMEDFVTVADFVLRIAPYSAH
jgi:hypothetical protein